MPFLVNIVDFVLCQDNPNWTLSSYGNNPLTLGYDLFSRFYESLPSFSQKNPWFESPKAFLNQYLTVMISTSKAESVFSTQVFCFDTADIRSLEVWKLRVAREIYGKADLVLFEHN